MSSRRLSAAALCLLAFSGCHEDPSVVTVTVQPAVTSLAVLVSGGAASSASGLDGVGGAGGQLQVVASGLVSVGSPTFVPTAPALPTQPSTFTLTPTTPLQNTPSPFSGNILLTGGITTDTTSPIVVKTDNGDIVVNGTLQSGDNGATMSDIQLIATNGTVYVNGTIRTSAPDAASNGRAAGNLSITAARVVILGTIDTHGVANTTVAAANGGAGGSVTITSSFGPIYFTAGSIFTAGGAVTDTGGNNSIQGGVGGAVTLTAPNQVFLFAPITTNGGAVTGNGTTPTGGAGGAINVTGSGEIDVISTLSSLGGTATGNGLDAVGGAAGPLNVNGPADCKFYGTLLTGGGAAFATGTGGTVTGGAGAILTFNGGLTSLEMGQGAFSFAGGIGMLSTGVGGGAGGIVHLESTAGDVTVGGSFSVAGGDGQGAGNAAGGVAGKIEIFSDAQFTTVSVPSLASGLDAFGGSASGLGAGGAGGTIYLQSGGSLTCGARIDASGGPSVAGVGGNCTTLPAIGTIPASTSSVVLRVATTGANLGNMLVTGEIHAEGGVVASGGGGGAGAGIGMEIAAGNGTLTSSATLTTIGGNGIGAGAGASGPILIANLAGDISLSGTLTANGASSPTVPTAAGNITVVSGGSLTFTGALLAVGGASTDPAGLVSGKPGGAIQLQGTSTRSAISVVGASLLQADGGAAPGANIATLGGAAGSILVQAAQQSISLSGSYLVRGGGVSGIGTGGSGGQVTVVTAGGGSITLNADGGIDASGGGGSLLGPARQNGADPGAAAGGALLAVLLDADSGTAATGGVAGQVVNLGSITATGSAGGDVYFDGLNALGGALPDPGLQNRVGTVVGQFYTH